MSLTIQEKLNKLRGFLGQDVLGSRLQRFYTLLIDLKARQAENKTYLDALKSTVNSMRTATSGASTFNESTRLLLSDLTTRQSENRALLSDLSTRQSENRLLLSDLSTRQSENRLLLSDMSTRHSEIKTLVDNIKLWVTDIDDALNYSVFSYAGLVKDASTPAEVKLTNRVDFTCGSPSLMYSVPANQNIVFTATTHDIATTASIRERCYMVEVTSSSSIRLIAGSIATGAGNAQFPASVSSRTQIAGVRISVDAGALTIFDATTTTLAATQLNAVTYYNFARSRPYIEPPTDTITALSDPVPTALTDPVPTAITDPVPTAITDTVPTAVSATIPAGAVSATVTAITATSPRTLNETGDWSY